MSEQLFIEELKKLGININSNQLKQLEKYYELLIEKNKVMNLTNITEKESVYLKHFYDSLTLTKVEDFNKVENLCDVGTGAGFPGLVIKIIFPNLHVVLVDSLNKRIKFLKEVISELNLEKIETIHARAEEYAKENRNRFDIVTSRAVARLSILNEFCLPMVKIGGSFICMKGNASEELKEDKKSIKILNSRIEKIEEFFLPIEESTRTLIKIRREGHIDYKYPRSFKETKKKPL